MACAQSVDQCKSELGLGLILHVLDVMEDEA